MTAPRTWLAGLLLVLAAVAGADELRFHPSSLTRLDVPGLSSIIEQETGIELVRIAAESAPIAALASREADLAVVENTQPFAPGVRTVMPLFSSVVHMAVRDDMDWEGFLQEQRQTRVELRGATHTARLVADLLFARAQSVPSGISLWTEGSGGVPDFLVYVGPILPQQTDWFRDGFRLVSMGRIDPAGAEFYTDGISYLHPQLTPTRIPALTYQLPGNETGIDALAVDMLLVTHRDTNPADVYRIVQVLLEQKPRFAAAQPQLFSWLREDFAKDHLSFPLHSGTRDYLAREDPGFLERYAETLNFIVYLVALMVTGIVGFGRWRARTRKDRIDRFYQRLLALRQRIGDDDAGTLLLEVDALESEAFDLLVRERLAADDSFRIFMDLTASLRRELGSPGETTPDA